ncbi:hypothetical protein AALB16_13970 [Lachnospiraceae bacterium 62-35]
MNEQKSGRGIIPWPWNLAVCVVIVLGTGYWIGYLFSALLGAAFLAWQRKLQPGMPEGGYCLEKTRKRISYLGLAVLLLFLGICVSVYGWMESQTDRASWDSMVYIKLVVSGIGGIGLILAGLYEGYAALRDSFWPEKSTLARSIRSQLPYPDEGSEVKKLFAIVDKDIKENGLWFDSIAVGREWILGDSASYIPRIRIFFGRDEIKCRTSNGHTRSTRIIELYILDDRKQTHIFSLRNPNELPQLLNCIQLRAPEALCRPYRELAKWRGKTEQEWNQMLQDYRLRQGTRETDEFLTTQAGNFFNS